MDVWVTKFQKIYNLLFKKSKLFGFFHYVGQLVGTLEEVI